MRGEREYLELELIDSPLAVRLLVLLLSEVLGQLSVLVLQIVQGSVLSFDLVLQVYDEFFLLLDLSLKLKILEFQLTDLCVGLGEGVLELDYLQVFAVQLVLELFLGPG